MGVAVLLAILYAGLGESYWRPVRHIVFDAYQRAFPRQIERLPVVIVDIDDASLAALGQWPWPRTRLARLIEAVRRMGALVVGLDMVMPEDDRLSPQAVIADRPELGATLRAELGRLPSNDALLAETLRQVPSVVGRVATKAPMATKATSDWQTPMRVHGEAPETHVRAYADHVTNVPDIEAAASGRGYLNTTPDADGVVRAVPLLLTVKGKLAPAFVLDVLRVAVGEPWFGVHSGPRGVRGIQIGTSFIPTEVDGRIRLHYTAPDSRRRVSALTILNGTADANRLNQHVTLIGVTAVGLTDVVVTPVKALMHGVEVQAQIIENILDRARLVRPLSAPWIELLVFVVVAVMLIGLLPAIGPGTRVVLFLVVAVLLTLGSLAGFLYAKWLVDASFPIAGQALILVVLLTAGFAAADRRKRELQLALDAERAATLRMAGELKAARDIQMGIVPAPGTIAGLPEAIDFHALLEPAEAVGGDLYDAFMLDAHRFFFLVGDVAGKGVPASLFMALSKTLCKSVALRDHLPLPDLMISINTEISRDNPADLFVTAVAGILDTRSGSVEWCRAGHQAPILLRQGEAPRVLDTDGGPPLCILDTFPYVTDTVQLQPGDTLVLVSDGVTEAQDVEAQFYGLDRVLRLLTTMSQNGAGVSSAAATCQELYDAIKRFASGAPPSDDLTIMTIRFTGSGAPAVA